MTTDLRDRRQWVLSVIQATERAGNYGTMQTFWPPDPVSPEDLAVALTVLARKCDVVLAGITGELRPDRRWSVGESMLTPRQWSEAAKRERDEHRREWHIRKRGKEVCQLDAGDCPHLAGEEE